ncbi:MAG: peptide-methionine (S)-S-oxide reductase MsrA [Planctomycetota bacterium]|nr:peptide-methionine (S)-S-oxide reductase MsrA [Planctomycetota bacterium]
MEDRFASLDGVVDVISGYMGGHQENPTYEQVCSGQTGHAEVVEIHYDRQKISYRELVRLFFALHDPTTPDRQGPNVGSQYRSVAFCSSGEEVQQLEQEMQRLKEEKAFGGNGFCTQIITSIPTFWRAEDYHQDYYQKHRGYCSR